MDKTDLPRGRHWRIFAPDYKCSTGPHLLTLLILFIIGHASSILSLQYYGEVLARPNLGIMLAGLLLLSKRDAIKFIVACNLAILVSYFFWDAPWPRTLIAPLLNTAEACLAAALIRRYCGARIDFSRPIRLARYFVYAIIPATLFRALAETMTGYGFLYGVSDNLATMLASHIVSMGLLTPLIVLIGQGAHKAPGSYHSEQQVIALFTLLIATCLVVFLQNSSPLLFITFLPLAWISYRLNLIHALVAAAIVIFIAAIATMEGWGPISLIHQVDIDQNPYWQDATLLRVTILQIFAASTLAMSLPLAVIQAEELRMEHRAKKRHKDTLAALHRVREGERELRHIALHDRETGLLGRPGIKEAIAHLLHYRRGPLLHVATLGIERYASFQSVIGSARAGQLVSEAGKRIAELFPNAPITRIAPDALTIAFFSPDRHAAREVLERLSTLFKDPVTLGFVDKGYPEFD